MLTFVVTLEQFLGEVSQQAVSSGIRLVVMKNYEGLPKVNLARDIDLICDSRTIGVLLRVLRSVCRALRLKLTPGRRYHYCYEHFVFGIAGHVNGLQIDVEPNCCWRGVEYASEQHIVANARPYRDGIWVPSPADEFMILFCQSYLYGGFVKEKYVPRMLSLLGMEFDAVARQLRSVFGTKNCTFIIHSLCNNRISSLNGAALALRLIAFAKSFLANPIRHTVTLLSGYALELSPSMRRQRRCADSVFTA